MKYTPIVWKFDTAFRKPLTQTQVNHYMQELQKIIKVGIEFEFNLPEDTGICDGNSDMCPCGRLKNNDCWKECLRKQGCKEVKEGKCPGLNCNAFMPVCIECQNKVIDCNTCKLASDPEKSPKRIRNAVRQALTPTHSYGRMGGTCCHKVIQDGSLRGDGGMEVVTIGRRVDYDEFYKMNKQIIDLALNNHGYMDELCSIHMHMLTSYYGKVNEERDNDLSIPNDINELEHPLPGIILANFQQLCRKYQNAITWMAMGLDSKQHLTRWEKFRMSILELSPLRNKMANAVSQIAGLGYKPKYAWANYMFTRFINEDDADRFHVEMRVLDCLMSPSAVSAFACLFPAMLLRAVELSRYGVFHIGDTQWLAEAKTVQKAIMNKAEGWPQKDDPLARKSNTEEVEKYKDLLSAEASELLQQVKHLLTITGDAYEVLEKLASKPIAYRRIEGQSWGEIENELKLQKYRDEYQEEDLELSEIIDRFVCLRTISNCSSIVSWEHKVKEALIKDYPNSASLAKKLKAYINVKKLNGQLVWSNQLGTVIKI